MNANKKNNRQLALAPLAHGVKWALAVAALSIAGVGAAQEQTPAATTDQSQDATTLETVSVLGSRTKPRTEASRRCRSTSSAARNSTTSRRSTCSTSCACWCRRSTSAPFRSTTPPRLVRPANLRGLPPDNTLVLVNGKRRHRAAVITFLGHGLSDGSQGPDISVFPSLALEQVEVLRDGAAAQYGSDAIAGVINFGLKQLDQGGTVEVFAGQYYEGDGFTQQYSAQIGLPLTAQRLRHADRRMAQRRCDLAQRAARRRGGGRGGRLSGRAEPGADLGFARGQRRFQVRRQRRHLRRERRCLRVRQLRQARRRRRLLLPQSDHARRRVLQRRRRDPADRRPRYRQRGDLPDHRAARRAAAT